MVPEACKCSENLRNDFFDLACNGLRTGHYDIVHRVDVLESVQREMSEEEKGAFKCLRELQINREREIEKLDLLWNCLLKAVRNSFTVKLRKPCTHENFRNVDFVYWPITIKFRIRKKTSKPQANYRCCLRLVISRLKPRKNVRNIVGQQLPTSLDVTHCVRLHTLLHVVRCCCVLLRKVWNRSNFFSQQLPTFLLFRDRRSVVQRCWIRLHNSSNIVGATHAHYAWFTKTYGLYPSHDALQVPTLLGDVASVCTPLPTRRQQLPTLLRQQCWELLRPFARSLIDWFLAAQ